MIIEPQYPQLVKLFGAHGGVRPQGIMVAPMQQFTRAPRTNRGLPVKCIDSILTDTIK